MNWTYHFPEENGFYWWRIESTASPTICQIVNGKIWAIGTAESFSLHHFAYQQFSLAQIPIPE